MKISIYRSTHPRGKDHLEAQSFVDFWHPCQLRRGSGGNSNSSSRNSQFTDKPSSREMFGQLSAFAEKVIKLVFDKTPGSFYVLIAVLLVLWLLQIFITTVGQIGLVRGAYHAEMGVEKIKFGELFSESLRYFWRLIGMGLLGLFAGNRHLCWHVRRNHIHL